MIKKDTLDFILEREFPELHVGSLWIEKTNNITSSEMSEVIRQIRYKKLIQKSKNILYEKFNYPDMNSIEYKLNSPEQEIYFEIEKTRDQNVFRGYFKTIKEDDLIKINDITLHNMFLRDGF